MSDRLKCDNHDVLKKKNKILNNSKKSVKLRFFRMEALKIDALLIGGVCQAPVFKASEMTRIGKAERNYNKMPLI